QKFTSTMVPSVAQQGVSVNNFGFGKLFPAGGSQNVVPAHDKNAHIRAGNVSDRPGLENEEARRMGSSLMAGKQFGRPFIRWQVNQSERGLCPLSKGRQEFNPTKLRCAGSGSS